MDNKENIEKNFAIEFEDKKMLKETENVIIVASFIYDILLNNDIKVKKYNLFEQIDNYELNNIDKLCISLFAASFYDDDVRKIMMDCGITFEHIRKYTKIFKENEFLSLENKKDANKYLNKVIFPYLNVLLKDINENSDILIDYQSLFVEMIVLYLISSKSGSDVIEWLFKECELGNTTEFTDNKCFSLLEESLEEKLELELKYRETFLSDLEKNDIDENETLNKYRNKKINSNFNPAIGREEELKKLMVALLSDNSVILVGKAAVGKTAIVEGFSYLLDKGLVPDLLKDKKVVNVSASSIISGTKYRGMLEQNLEELLAQVEDNPNIILFIDEIHTLINKGVSMDIANILKPYLDRGKIKVIGATTDLEYEKYILSDPAFRRRFEKIEVKEPNDKLLYDILFNTIPKIEEATKIKFDFNKEETSKIINAIIKVTNKNFRKYDDEMNNPNLALSILKKSFGYAAFYNSKVLKFEHIIEAIKENDVIYESAKENISLTIKQPTYNNVIDFQTKKRELKPL